MWVPFADTVVVVTNDPVPTLLKNPDEKVHNALALPIKDRYKHTCTLPERRITLALCTRLTLLLK